MFKYEFNFGSTADVFRFFQTNIIYGPIVRGDVTFSISKKLFDEIADAFVQIFAMDTLNAMPEWNDKVMQMTLRFMAARRKL